MAAAVFGTAGTSSRVASGEIMDDRIAPAS